MSVINKSGYLHTIFGVSRVGIAATLLLVGLSAAALVVDTTGGRKLVGISWIAFLAMATAVPLGARTGDRSAGGLVWGYGLAAGAMVTSAAVFLIPQAIGQHPRWGGFGIAFGLLAGFASHTIGHRLAHLDLPMDRTVAELTAHAFSAGIIIGIIYGNMPDLGALLGLAIVSHKGPAGYAAARRLVDAGRDPSILLLPATGVGIAGLASAQVALPASGPVRGIVFGFAGGIFLHVAMDFLPRCEIGSEVHELLSVSGDAHTLLDRLRLHAVASTSIGGVVVLLAWLIIA